jgi:phosphoadenosine phosphosulfate reductase
MSLWSAEALNESIRILQALEPPDGYKLAFSGGKDSVVLYQVAKLAGVKFHPFYNVTTVDPPELLGFMKRNYPDVSWLRPKRTMEQLIAHKGYPPTHTQRYCCQHLKELSVMGSLLTGVRWAESARRKKNRSVIELQQTKHGKRIKINKTCDSNLEILKYDKGHKIINPIIHWSNEMVWDFIKERNIPICELYAEGWKRLGCVGCPMGGSKNMRREFERWPQYKILYIRAFDKMLQHRKGIGKEPFASIPNESGQAVFDWWVKDWRKIKNETIETEVREEER